jgi:plastocyanin
MKPIFLGSVLAAIILWAVPAATMPPQHRITIESASPYFLPTTAIVRRGAEIRWENPTATYHTITHDGCVTAGPCLFDSGSIAPDSSYALAGLPPGRYPYHCRLHPIMRGVIEVHDGQEARHDALDQGNLPGLN